MRGEIIEGVEVAALWCGGTTQWANAVRGADVAPPPPDTIVQWVMAKVYGVIYSSRTNQPPRLTPRMYGVFVLMAAVALVV